MSKQVPQLKSLSQSQVADLRLASSKLSGPNRLNDIFRCSMSSATIVKLSNTVKQSFEPLLENLSATIQASPVKHLDETGLRIRGHTQWLHVVSTATETWYRTAVKRKDLEPLKMMTDVAVHDHWKPYFQLEGLAHSLCNAHHLRELKALQEIEKESWATSMNTLLRVRLPL